MKIIMNRRACAIVALVFVSALLTMIGARAQEAVKSDSRNGVTATLTYEMKENRQYNGIWPTRGQLEIHTPHGSQRFDLGAALPAPLSGNYEIKRDVAETSGSGYGDFSVLVESAAGSPVPYVILRFTQCAGAGCMREDHLFYADATGQYREAPTSSVAASNDALREASTVQVSTLQTVGELTVVDGHSSCGGDSVVAISNASSIHAGSVLEVGHLHASQVVKMVDATHAPMCNSSDAVLADPLRIEGVLDGLYHALKNPSLQYMPAGVLTNGRGIPGEFVYNAQRFRIVIDTNADHRVRDIAMQDESYRPCSGEHYGGMKQAFEFAFRDEPFILNDFMHAADRGALGDGCQKGRTFVGKRFGYRFSSTYNTLTIVPASQLMDAGGE